jgi:hypothetical protein
MKPLRPLHTIPPERKAIYAVGLFLSGIGLLMFLSTFLTFAMHFGDFSNFEANARSDAFRAFGGMILLILGGIIATVGARGVAGSGLMLDPVRAREELEPYARASGHLTDAAFSEMHTVREALAGIGGHSQAEPSVKVRCRGCQALNDEHAKFCDQCGAAV